MNSPGFSISDCAFSTSPELVPYGAACPDATQSTDALSGTLIHTGLDNVTGFADPHASGAALAGGAGLAQLQEKLKCGTECGSCVPELKRMCAVAGSRSQESGFGQSRFAISASRTHTASEIPNSDS